MKNSFTKFMLLLMAMVSFASNMLAPDNISGIVFLDFNSNGIKDPDAISFNEVGYGGVTVTAYDATNAPVATTTSAADGSYSLTVAFPVRIEFTGLSSDLSSSFVGTSSSSNVQFYSNATSTANYGILNPDLFSKNNPSVLVAGQVNGSSTGRTETAIYGMANGVALTGLQNLQTVGNVGSVWGLAYDKRNNIVYSSAFLKRHADFGPKGIAGLYWGRYSSSGLTSTGSADLEPLTPTTSFGTNPRTAGELNGVGVNTPSRDLGAYAQVGKRGIGDIDISNDGKTLYVMNLNDRKLEAFNVSSVASGGSPTYLGSYNITDPGCENGDWRPFAIKVVSPDLIYVGVTCTAETSGDRTKVVAYVCKIVPSAGFAASSAIVPINSASMPTNPSYASVGTVQPPPAAPANSIPLYYNRAGLSSTPGNYSNDQFQAWTDTWPLATVVAGNISYPQPLLSDIEINRKGDLILGIMDRMGHRAGNLNYDNSSSNTTLYQYYSYGDILYTKNTGTAGTPVYYLEGTSQNPGTQNFEATQYGFPYLQGPGGPEYFNDHTDRGHDENTLGGIGFLPNENIALSTVMDANGTQTFSNGISSWNNSNGNLLTSAMLSASNGFGKASGMGDIEILADVAPIQIGNRIWNDTDKDGVQDADETAPGVAAGTTVTLRSPGLDGNFATTSDNQSWTTTTDANGNYYFSALSSKDNRSPVGILTNTVLPGFDYRIEVGMPAGGYSLSPADVGSNGSDNIDSDAILNGASAFVTFNTQVTNHNFDIGVYFECPVFSNPSTAQTICSGTNGSDLTINSSSSVTNGVKFVRYTTDQTAVNGSETTSELNAIYTGGTALATVTPTGTSSPYTATYPFSTASFPNTGNTPVTYYVYAIANPDMGATCRPIQEIIITVDPKATVTAGGPDIACLGSPTASITLSGSTFDGAATTAAWSITSITGTMVNDPAQLSSTAQTATPSAVTFTPAAGTAGTVTLTLTTNKPTGTCPAATATRVITINPPAAAVAGSDNIICAGTAYALSGSSVSGAATTGAWSITGTTGSMTNATSQLSSLAQTASPQTITFTPIAGNSGTVTLTLTSNDPTGPCPAATSTVTLTVNPAATVSAGTSQSVAAGGTVNLTGIIGGSATSAAWSAPSGTFSDVNSLTSTYTPSILSGSVVLTLTTNDPSGPCGPVTSTVTITVSGVPTFTVDQLTATCTALTSNNNGSIRITAQTNGTKYGVSTLNAGTYDGPAFATATTMPGALPATVKTAVPNSGGTYIIRVFNNSSSVFTDQTVTVTPVICSNYCPTTSLTTAIAANNDNARQNGADVATNPVSLNLAKRYLALRFSSVNIPKNATITSAYIQFTANSASTSGVQGLIIKAHASDNSAQLTTNATSSEISNKFNSAATTASVSWTNSANWATGEAGINQRTPDISSVVQEVVNRTEWATNNPVHILIDANTNTLATGPIANSYSTNGTTGVPQLVITYEISTTISNPSVNQALCAGTSGSDITVTTNQNISNSIKFIRFTSDQIAGATPTPAEMSAIYAGTGIATVTPTGSVNSYTATYFWNTADFPNTTNTPVTYFVYAVLNPQPGSASCNPVQEIQIVINPCKVNLGNRVWNDKNNDGIQDPLEPGISGLTVNLYTDLDNNGIADLPVFSTTTTDANGLYLFDNLSPGKYIVGVVNPAGNYIKSAVNGGSPDTNPADNDNNGITTTAGITYSNAVTLAVGAEPAGENPDNNENPNITDNSSNLTVDFGFFDPSALPVTLISFTGKSEKPGLVKLNWSTSAEVNNSHYIIERSSNAVQFEEIGRIDGKGNSKSVTKYEFEDMYAQLAVNYYRLKQVDWDGTSTPSRILAINSVSETLFAAFPNPASDKVSIETDMATVSSIKLYDLSGKLLLSQTVGNEIDVKSLIEGLYIIQLTRKDGGVSNAKIVIKK